MAPEFDRYAGDYETLLKDPVREYFAPGSDFFVRRKLDVLLDFARRAGFDAGRMDWLDVGCGKGQLLRAGRPLFRRVVGCDVSAAMLEGVGDLEVADQPELDRLPFDAASVDLVTAVCVYHHIALDSRARLTEDIWRVLRPGGAFAIIEHNPLNPIVQLIVRRTPVDADARLLLSGAARRLLHEARFELSGTRFFLYAPQRIYSRVAAMEQALGRVPLGGQYAVFGLKPSS